MIVILILFYYNDVLMLLASFQVKNNNYSCLALIITVRVFVSRKQIIVQARKMVFTSTKIRDDVKVQELKPPLVNHQSGAALQGGCGGVEHPPTRHQLGKSLTSVGKTGLAKDNH